LRTELKGEYYGLKIIRQEETGENYMLRSFLASIFTMCKYKECDGLGVYGTYMVEDSKECIWNT
jgi:hypothetical protein